MVSGPLGIYGLSIKMDKSSSSESKAVSKMQLEKSTVGPKPYMQDNWWLFLPFYIFIALAILQLIVMVFTGATAGMFLGYVIFAILWALLIWWVCDIGELGWAWFILLLPLIVAVLIGIVSAGVTGGILSLEAMKHHAAKLKL